MTTLSLRRLLLTFVAAMGLVVATNTTLVGQQPALPAARDIITRFVRALGGEEAHKAVKSIRAQGTFELVAQGISGTLELMNARPARMFVRIDMAGVGQVLSGYDGKIAWEIQPLKGPALITGRRLMEMADDAWFDSALHAPDHVKTMTTVAKTTFDNRPAYQVHVTYISGSEATEYFDVETGLMIGNEASRETEMGVLPQISFMRDYKKFGGIMQPTTLVQRVMGIEQVLRLTSFEFDTVPDTTFDLPPQIKAMIK
jgi:hypothetical protein